MNLLGIAVFASKVGEVDLQLHLSAEFRLRLHLDFDREARKFLVWAACLYGQVGPKGKIALDPRTVPATVLLLFLPPVMTSAAKPYSEAGNQSGGALHEKRSRAGRRYPDQSSAHKRSGSSRNNSDCSPGFLPRRASGLRGRCRRFQAELFHGFLSTQPLEREFWSSRRRQTVHTDRDRVEHGKRRNQHHAGFTLQYALHHDGNDHTDVARGRPNRKLHSCSEPDSRG